MASRPRSALAANQLLVDLALEALDRREWPPIGLEMLILRSGVFDAQVIARDLIAAGCESEIKNTRQCTSAVPLTHARAGIIELTCRSACIILTAKLGQVIRKVHAEGMDEVVRPWPSRFPFRAYSPNTASHAPAARRHPIVAPAMRLPTFSAASTRCASAMWA